MRPFAEIHALAQALVLAGNAEQSCTKFIGKAIICEGGAGSGAMPVTTLKALDHPSTRPGAITIMIPSAICDSFLSGDRAHWSIPHHVQSALFEITGAFLKNHEKFIN